MQPVGKIGQKELGGNVGKRACWENRTTRAKQHKNRSRFSDLFAVVRSGCNHGQHRSLQREVHWLFPLGVHAAGGVAACSGCTCSRRSGCMQWVYMQQAERVAACDTANPICSQTVSQFLDFYFFPVDNYRQQQTTGTMCRERGAEWQRAETLQHPHSVSSSKLLVL